MTAGLGVVRLQAASGLGEDVVINTWHFDPVLGSATPFLVSDAAIATNLLTDFYTDPNGVDTTVSEYFNNSISRSALSSRIIWYANPEPPLGFPILETLWTPNAAASATYLPRETAICLSYHAALALPGAQNARRRGRIYIGPLTTAAGVISGTSFRPSLTVTDSLRNYAERLRDDSQAVGSTPWVVYSRVGNSSAEVTAGWVDNAFDTIRSRGEDPTVRNVWS